jgi:hypothetical protein
MEHRAGGIREAQALFQRAIKADPAHVWSYQVGSFSAFPHLSRNSTTISRGAHTGVAFADIVAKGLVAIVSARVGGRSQLVIPANG